MSKRGSARKARVFTIPTHIQPVPAAPASAAARVRAKVQAAKKPAEKSVAEKPAVANPIGGVQVTLRDNETAYLVGALLDAKRGAEQECQHAISIGDIAQAQVLENKIVTLNDLTTRIAQAITRRSRA